MFPIEGFETVRCGLVPARMSSRYYYGMVRAVKYGLWR